ncbi:MAG TPA: tryptophan 7-halogenase [Blastocatellia bacterium]|nr:tryptophan 7-halogenase [Blastocatellia bacterium]
MIEAEVESDATSCDVLVVGGGPAGCAAALTLLKYSPLSVAVVECSDYDRTRVGETVSPGIQPLLGYLDVWERFMADEHLPAYSTCAAWGSSQVVSHDFLFTGYGNGWHLDRRRFDRALADDVAGRGGTLLTRTRVAALSRDVNGGWRCSIAPKDGLKRELSARFLIDASGRKFALARRFGARQQVYDYLLGIVGFYEFDDDGVRPHYTLVETCESGWWYSSLLPHKRMVVALMSDIDIVRRARAQSMEGWNVMLAATEHTRQRLAEARPSAPLQVRPAHSHILQPAAGPGWIAVGDAAASFDPLAAMGIGHALTSGIHAARVAFDELAFDATLMPHYTNNLAHNFYQYLNMRRQYYLIEQRWPESIFWSRRHKALNRAVERGVG